MKLKVIAITGWSASSLFAYDKCPLQCQLRYAQHLCTLCFKGTVPYNATCSKCGKAPVKPAAMQRGIEIGDSIDRYIKDATGKGEVLHPEAKSHVVVSDLIRTLKGSYKRSLGEKVLSEVQIKLDKNWKPVGQYIKSWVNGRLDVLLKLGAKGRKVIDWKSGGIDKKTRQIRESPEYQEQLEIYSVLVLSADPKVQTVDSSLVFLDAPVNVNPEVTSPAVHRKDLVKLQKKWEGRVKPLLSDTVFAPRPGWYCGWCDYSKEKGGPCPVA